MTRHPALAAVAAALAAASVWGVLAWRAQVTTLTAYRLCVVFSTIVAQSDRTLGRPGTSAHAYFKANPDALKAAHRENRRLLAELPCSPPLPPTH